MRIRATAAAVTISGALALTALAVPAAQADGQGNKALTAAAKQLAAGYQDGHAASRASAFAASTGYDEQWGDTVLSNTTVNGGKGIVLGTSAKANFKVTFTATDPAGIDNTSGYAIVYHGTDLDSSNTGALPNEADGATTCKTVNATTSTCTLSFTVDPRSLWNTDAGGGWKVYAAAQAKDGDYSIHEKARSFAAKRYSKLTTNAAPEPVAKGKTITVTGLLSRANWDTAKYMGYTKQTVTLQYRKKTSSTYSNVKTVTSSSTGALKTTVKASADGYFRYKFAGTSTTPAATSVSDYVDVR
ncbi:calcium-binding protein [Streptomyces sp. NPDC102467]|uniref:calcium-binding protein n=1 Tax=Streptomyces sp. NPDC102467 TaxID=3366179 RepID=UPI003814A5A1